jgi:hypothetical protein
MSTLVEYLLWGGKFILDTPIRIPASLITGDDPGALSLAECSFSLRLRKDFLPVLLPRIAPFPGSLTAVGRPGIYRGTLAYSFPSLPFCFSC